jgi:hypothetical protein
MTFRRSFLQLNATRSSNTLEDLDENSLRRIREMNHLDIKLYEHALDLLKQRFETVKNSDPDFSYRFHQINAASWDPDELEEKMIERITKQKEEERLNRKSV